MSKRVITISIFLCVLPALTLGLVIAYFLSDAYQSTRYQGGLSSFLAAVAALLGIYALALVISISAVRKDSRRLLGEAQEHANLNKELMSQRRELQTEVDFLSTMREALITVTQDLDAETVLQKVLELTGDIVRAKGREEIGIFKCDEDGKPVPLAYRKEGATLFGRELEKVYIDKHNVAECAEYKRLFRLADEDQLDIALPLTADREIVGVLKVVVPLEGHREEKHALAELLEQNLQNFANTVALAIKTPDLYTRTITDGLTGLYSKRHFLSQIPTYFEMARRHNEPLSMLMVDIDHFKQVNDTHGHQTGDIVLKAVAGVLKKASRLSDSVYRYGGEEMGILMPESSVREAEMTAERLRKKVESKKMTGSDKEEVRVTISIGVATFMPGMTGFQQIVEHADKALYEAKRTGRNKVCVFGAPIPQQVETSA
ncbi:MAG: sensor domain-containing diguanylate cyclase [Planctomycetota bacterium]|nr:sensor domain-containing diguanylate cyclase [Planctomycetota bacterium]